MPGSFVHRTIKDEIADALATNMPITKMIFSYLFQSRNSRSIEWQMIEIMEI
jgi:hypothetical protein